MTVRSSAREYEIVRIGQEAVASLNRAFFITDEEVARRHGELIPPTSRVLALPAGESSKSLAAFGQCLSWLAAGGADRSSTVVAFGGGVIGDLAGFVAASFMRGVSYVQVPTTLLAQVDSSVGGKVAIDLPEGKNLAGAFYPPAQVLVGGHFLRTLPDRQLRNGLAEVLKYGFIADPQILASTAQGLLENLDAVVDNCIQIKARIVEEDEFETNGIRAALNFGHTIGHALEAELHYEGLLHGEAVAIGMMVEARLGEMIGFTRSGIAQSVAEHLLKAELPTTHPALKKVDSLLDSMRRDKKARNGKLTFSLIPEIGSCKLVTGVREEDVRAALLA